MGRGGRREEVLRVEGRCQLGWVGGGRRQWAAAATAGRGLQSCARMVSAGKPESSKKGLVVRIKALILILNLIRPCRLQPVVALVIKNMYVYITNEQHSALQSQPRRRCLGTRKLWWGN